MNEATFGLSTTEILGSSMARADKRPHPVARRYTTRATRSAREPTGNELTVPLPEKREASRTGDQTIDAGKARPRAFGRLSITRYGLKLCLRKSHHFFILIAFSKVSFFLVHSGFANRTQRALSNWIAGVAEEECRHYEWLNRLGLGIQKFASMGSIEAILSN